MTEVATKDILLNWDVFVTPGIPVVTRAEVPPGSERRMFSPISSTLIYGKRDAVLVDTFITVEQVRAQMDWVAARAKNLTMIYATHGHGDHFFGAGAFLERFPGARFVATPDIIEIMRQQTSPQYLTSFWKRRFPGQISDHLVIAEKLAGNVIRLEGHDLIAVPLGHTDTDNTTCLQVPSIGLVVAGDAAYNDVHLHLGESKMKKRAASGLPPSIRSRHLSLAR